MKRFLIFIVVIICACCLLTGCFNEDNDKDGVSDMAEAQAGDIDDSLDKPETQQESEVVPEGSVNEMQITDFMTVTGHITEIRNEDGNISAIIKSNEDDAVQGEYTARLTQETRIINTLLEKKNKEDLKENAEVRVILDSSTGTMIPNMADAKIMILKEEDNTSFPHYIHVADMEYEEGTLSALNANGDVIINIDEKMEIATLDSEQMASINDIKEGSELLCWYDSLTLSDPATAVPTRIVLITDTAE